MDKIKNVVQRLGIITVEDMERYTALELIMMIANKMNEFQTIINDYSDELQNLNDKIQYLLNEGTEAEVVKIFDEWLQDGTFDTLINQSAFKEVNDRIDETNAQLTEIDIKKASLSYVDTVISQIKSTTPKGVYANLNELISAKPAGDDNIYLTSDNGHWNYWNGSTWVSGGLYQAIEIENNSIANHKLNFNAVDGMDSFNLFNPEAVTKNYYVSQSSGALIANSEFNVSDFIAVNEKLTYFVRVGKGNLNLPMAWFNESKNFLKGEVASTTKTGFLTPPKGAKFCRFTIKTLEPENQMDNFLFCQSDEAEEYAPYGHKVGTEQLDIKVCELVKSNNMFDKNNVIVDKYISGAGGGFGTSTNHVASDWIKVKPSTKYTFSKLNGNFEQYAFYDKDQEFISGVTKPTSGEYTTPSNCYYVRHTVSKVQINDFMLNAGEEISYEPFGYFIPKEVMPFNSKDEGFIKIITVDKNGNGDFTSIYDAVMSIASTSPNKRCEIRIAEGEYNIISELPTEMINNPNSFPGGRGLDIPSYVKLVGVGHRDKIIIKGELPDDATVDQVKYLSTLNYGGDVILENLTITAKNMRYPIHADSGSQEHNNVYQVINCHVIHYGNQPSRWQYCSCFGSGHGKNAKVLMKDSCFETYGVNSNAWGIHNYKTATEKSNMILENCEFIAHNGGTSCNFESLGSGIKDYALIKNCYIPNGVTVTENSSGVGIDIVVEGYNNSTSLTKY